MRRSGLPWRVIGCGIVLLNILLYSEVAPAQLTINPSSISFGSVPVSSSAMQSLVLGNSGGSNLTVSQAAMSGSGFSLSGPALPLTLVAGQSASFSVTFAPQSSGTVNGSLSLTWIPPLRNNGKRKGWSSKATTVLVSGTGTIQCTASTTLGANPSSLSFGSVQVGNTKTLSEAVTNTGGSSVTLSQATVVGTGFSISGLSLPLTLAAGQSVTFAATFAPQSAGSASANISVSSNASNSTMTISLAGSGTAQGQLAVTPMSVDFGSVTVGTSKTQAGTLSASGSSVSVSSATVTSAEFSLGGITFPLTIAAGQSVPFTLTFTAPPSAEPSAS